MVHLTIEPTNRRGCLLHRLSVALILLVFRARLRRWCDDGAEDAEACAGAGEAPLLVGGSASASRASMCPLSARPMTGRRHVMV